MNSSRKYKITYFDREDVKETEVKIQDIIGITDTDFNDLEMQYSLHEILDEILDMKLWELFRLENVKVSMKLPTILIVKLKIDFNL